MPKFTITTDSAHDRQTADEPLDFPNTRAATDDAQVALAEMAMEKLPNGKAASFAVTVEDEAGEPVYRAGLEFRAATEADLDRQEQDADAAACDVASLLASSPRH